jgi:hypothetical protein
MTRKISMIVFILFVLAIAHNAKSQERPGYSALVIQYVGESDAYVVPIIISDSKAGADWCRTSVLKKYESVLTHNYVVSTSLMADLIAEAETYRGTPQQAAKKKTPNTWDTVLITVVTPDNTRAFPLPADPGISLVGGLKALSKGEEALRSDLSNFVGRITANRRAYAP